MTDLDDLEAIAKLDTGGVLGELERFGEQCRDAWDRGRAARGLPAADGVDSVVVLGMGGSGLSGDIVQALVEPRLPLPLRTIKSYGPLPEWVGRNTIALAVSYSGNTEETLAALELLRSTAGLRHQHPATTTPRTRPRRASQPPLPGIS